MSGVNCLETPDCRSFLPGHNMHVIHAGRIAAAPWGWRDALVVSAAQDGWLVLAYVLEHGVVHAWHHAPLDGALAPGAAVRVHEERCALGTPFGWLHVDISVGVGPVAKPASTDLWRSESTAAAVEVTTGRALAADHTGTRL